MFSFNHKFAALTALWVATAASAAPTPSQIFKGEDQNPGFTVPNPSNSLTARTNFLASFNTSVSSGGFGFEAPFAGGDTPPLIADFSGSGGTTTRATITGDGSVSNVGEAGRFNTTAGGSNYFQAGSEDTSTFSISFSRNISAFGFYATDVGDFFGTLTLLLERSSDGGIDELVVSNTSAPTGSLLFYGFADAGSSYRRISFRTTGDTSTGTDYFGFDDFVVADAGQIIVPPTGTPEPGSLALAGLALGAAMWARQRRPAR